MARATTVGEIAGALTIRAEEASILAELKSGSEEAYTWLIAHYHQPVYGLVYRILSDPADAADTTQEVFLKVFRGMKNFNGEASLKTWIYRIAVHEASNQRRWWYRHKRKETSIETEQTIDAAGGEGLALGDTLADDHESPYECFAHEEVRAKVEAELKEVPEPYRTAVVLRDIEGLAYEEIAEILQVNLGTVKSRLMRGREALRKRLVPYVKQFAQELGVEQPQEKEKQEGRKAVARVGSVAEVRTRR